MTKQMTKSEFEDWMRVRQFRPMAICRTRHGDVLVYEGEVHFPEFHYRTGWMLDRGTVGFGRWLEHRRFGVDEDGVFRVVTPDMRLADTLQDAYEHMTAQFGDVGNVKLEV